MFRNRRCIEIVWDGATQISFTRGQENLAEKIEPHNRRLHAEADQAQRGQNYRTRLVDVKSIPQITTLGVKVPRTRPKVVEEGKGYTIEIILKTMNISWAND